MPHDSADRGGGKAARDWSASLLPCDMRENRRARGARNGPAQSLGLNAEPLFELG
jgi:hypothetical protein